MQFRADFREIDRPEGRMAALALDRGDAQQGGDRRHGAVDLAQGGLNGLPRGRAFWGGRDPLLQNGPHVDERRAQIMSDIVADRAELTKQPLDFVKHFVDGGDHAVEFVDPRTARQTRAKVALHDFRNSAVDLRNSLAASARQEKSRHERAGRYGQYGEGQRPRENSPEHRHFRETAPQNDDPSIRPDAGDHERRFGLARLRRSEIGEIMGAPVRGNIWLAIEIAKYEFTRRVIKGDEIQPPEIAGKPERQGALQALVVACRRLFRLVREDVSATAKSTPRWSLRKRRRRRRRSGEG